MRRVLYVQEALNFNPGNLEFVDFIYGLGNFRITAVFLDKIAEERNDEKIWETAAMQAGSKMTVPQKSFHQKVSEDNIQRFIEACYARDIPYDILRESTGVLKYILQESRYADLLILDMASYKAAFPSYFAEDLLRNAECPVLVMPLAFEGIEELVFTYDGTLSSVYAVKQFTYLFPQMCNYKTAVVCINPEQVAEADWNKFREWMFASYARVEFLYAEGNVDDELVELLHKRDHPFIIMGAYGRGIVSGFLRPSHANLVIQLTSEALFIAHPKRTDHEEDIGSV